jgi:hypothetical protein
MKSQRVTLKAAILLIALIVISEASTAQSSGTVIWSKQEVSSPSIYSAIVYSPDGRLYGYVLANGRASVALSPVLP